MHTNRDILVRNLFENMNALKRGVAGHLQLATRDCPISSSQFELLRTIRQMQPVSFKQLARQLYLTPGAVSQLVEGLELHDYVSRHADERDRRMQLLHVSKRGAKLLQNIEKHRQSMLDMLIQDLSDEELTVWLRVQTKMIQHFQSETTIHSKKETP